MRKIIIFLVLFLLLFCGLAGTAQAAATSYTASSDIIKVDSDQPVANLTTIYNAINNNSVLSHTGKTWYLNATIDSVRTNQIYINNSDCDELIIDTPNRFLDGSFIHIDNTTITGGGQISTRGTITNTIRRDGGRLYFYYMTDKEIYNVTIENCTAGIYGWNCANLTVHNISAANLSQDGIWFGTCNNITGYNFYVYNASSYLIHDTYAGIRYTNTTNSTLHDLYVNGCGWGGIEVNQNSSNVHVYNGTVTHPGHNGVDLHGCQNTLVENITIYDLPMVESNFFTICGTGSGIGLYNVTVRDIYGTDARGNGFDINTRLHDVYIENVTMRNCSSMFAVFDASNITFLNSTSIDHRGNAVFLNTGGIAPANNITIADLTVINSSGTDMRIEAVTNATFLNIDPDAIWSFKTGGQNASIYSYADFIVKNETGALIPNAVITSNATTLNAYGRSSTPFLTNSNGRTYTTGNRSTGMAIPLKYLYTNTTSYYSTIYNSSEINVSGNGMFRLYAVSPIESWFTPSHLNRKYTITSILNSSEALHITGYTPTLENNVNSFSNGDVVKLQIWTNKILTSVVWKKDGVEVQNSTSTSYTTTMSNAPITVDITGATATETISKTFVVDPNQVLDPDPEEPDPENPTYPPIANFTSSVTNGTIPLFVQFNDTSENATAWYWDFDNNGKTDSTVRNATFTYRTQGNYTAKLTVSNSEGMNTTTRIITAEKQSWYIVFWSWIFGVAGGLV